jgi:transposase
MNYFSPESLRVISQSQQPGIGIMLQVDSISKESHCHRCGTKSHRLHQNHRYVVKDLSWGEKPVFLEINRRQFKCKKCGKPFSEKLDFVMNRRTYTKRLATQTIQEVLKSDIHSVAKKGVVTTEEIEKMLEDASLQLSSKPSALKKLGIDEIALIKGQGNYCAVLIDLETSKLITIIPGRTQVDIKKVLISWGTEVLEQIEEVSIDLWRGYKTLVMDLIPNVQVVADRFHVDSTSKQGVRHTEKTRKNPGNRFRKNTKLRSKKAECQQTFRGIKQKQVFLIEK